MYQPDHLLGNLAPPDASFRSKAPHPGVGPQHVADPRLLLGALERARRAASDLAPLADMLLSRMPRTPLASSSLKTGAASSGPCLLDAAVSETWFSINTADWTAAVGTDCDHALAADRVDDFMYYLREVDPRAPRPLVVSDPYTMRAHVTWLLDRDVYTGEQTREGAGRSAPILRTLGAVQRGIAVALEADPGFTNRLTKNPWAPGRAPSVGGRPPAEPGTWERYVEGRPTLRFLTDPGDCRTVSLLTLWRALKLWREDSGLSIPGPQRKRVVDEDGMEKGSRLFNASRFPVYDLGTTDLATIAGVVDETAARLGSPASPKARETIARSICRFMRTKYTGEKKAGPDGKVHKRRGVMGLDAASLDRHERQALGGKFSARANARDTDRRVADAVSHLQAAGKKLTQATIAAEAGVSERTVRGRWHGPAKAAKQCASGRAAPGPLGAATPAPDSIPSLAVLAMADRKVVRTVEQLTSLAAAARHPGARPPALPVISPSLAAHFRVQRALASAILAAADARRREENRARKAAAARRAADRRDWHAAHAGDHGAWQARLKDIADQKAAAMASVRARMNSAMSERVEMAYSSLFGAERRARKLAVATARKGAGQEPSVPRPGMPDALRTVPNPSLPGRVPMQGAQPPAGRSPALARAA